MCTNISVMVSFMVVVETTRFHTAYKEYMEGVIGGTYKMIVKGRKKPFRTLSQQIVQVAWHADCNYIGWHFCLWYCLARK
ncbi:MAG: exopolysaccharide Pel transporter PelG [Blautia wexlerae]